MRNEYIAIGTDGNAVNMALWNPTLNDDGTWLLGISYDYYEINDAYSGSITDDGKIEGCVPQYIYNETKRKFTPVTKMRSTFAFSNLEISPEIPDTVTDMYSCFVFSAIKEIPKLSKNLNTSDRMFEQCNNLEKITIPSGVTSIGFMSFSTCSALTEVIISNSVTNIEERAFEYCDALEHVYYTGTQAEWNAITIGDGNTSLTSATIHYNYSN